MKKIEAIIRPSKLKAVQKALKISGIPCITVIPVKGTGLQKGYSERYRGTEQSMILHTRVMIVCVVSDNNMEKCIEIIIENASDGRLGDGKIFVYHVEEAIRLSSRVRGVEAIH
ncbi:P-II family nitrogen regulator [Flavobacterium sp.]|uniref:P-II family nitrogen regulator n=1 Tax=Flavobacterium sp. TaxID=239 RepID=UPI0040470F6B